MKDLYDVLIVGGGVIGSAIAKDPNYGEIICRCQKVSKAEILQAIHNPLGVRTMVGIKYRTRSMMGRCQGGYCQMRIEQLLEEELGLEPEEILYNKPDSRFGSMRKASGISSLWNEKST